MEVYIPTAKRGPVRQITYMLLQPLCPYDMWLVCPEEETAEFAAYKYRVRPTPAKGIGAVRQWIVDNASSNKVLMLDDDLSQWATRRNPAVGHYAKATAQDVRLTLQRVDALLDTYAHVGIGHRLFANNQQPCELNTRAMRAFGLRRDLLQRHNIKFAPLVEDLEIVVQLLRAGYSNCVDYVTVQDQPQSNAPGGCSTYRTPEYHNAWVEQVHAWHPAYTRVVTKTTAGGWFNGMPRKELVISWSKLAKDFAPTTIAQHHGRTHHTRDNHERP